MLLSLLSLLAGATSGAASSGVVLQSRAVQVLAQCQTQFAWADNSNHNSPCFVAASVDAFCNGNILTGLEDWVLPGLNGTNSYGVPSPASASFCTCSWASYNLISACAACQGFPETISNWTPYIANCAGKLSESYFPSNLTLPNNVLIPWWATTDRLYPYSATLATTWPNQIFNVPTAQNIATQGHADVSTPLQPGQGKKSTPVGAIVGGVIGGILVIGAAIALAVYLMRRQPKPSQSLPMSSVMSQNGHMRSTSDVTTKSHGMSMGYTTLSSTPMVTNPPTSPTIRTHNSSVRSLPFFSSVVASTAPYGSPSPPPGRQMAASPPLPTNREDIIVPYTVPPVGHNPDSKQANGAYPVYDSPSAPHPNAMRMEVSPQTPTQGRTRYNPPAYTEQGTSGSATPPSGSAPRRPPHTKKGSADTMHSMTSSRSGGTRHGANASISAMGNVVNQMGVGNSTTASPYGGENAMPSGHGRQVSSSRDEKRQPTDTEDSFSARDIA
ncbi:hypothetical protein B0H34DRAFT_670655 [Crassisporium funariophilum]|nr:hypothetical protein B0H34DRAFT_670655 [Crassisporium funariophilum]